MTKTKITWIAGAVAAAGLAFATQAVQAQSRGNVADAPIAYGADQIARTPTGLSMRGRAELTQGGNRMRADAVTASTTDNQLNRIEATGNVYYVTPNETIRADHAVYTASNDTIILTGDVILTQGKSVMTGSRLTYNVRTETAEMGGGRVQGVFYPQGSN
ncbi:MAG: LPS ABC transporter substrate-binding protein LptA [Caulobacteraceae bacterium]|nr:LPS ABC transporter substrate-binding protein LptA [Caulobacteraceae bacterium]